MADLLLAASSEHVKTNGSGSGLDWLSTHPDTAQRAQAMKAGDAAQCRRP